MLVWLIESASIKLKLTIAFFLQFTFAASLLALLYLVGAQQLPVNIALLVGGGVVLASTAIGFFFRRSVVAPHISMVTRMEALAAGDFASPIPFTHRRDCFGRMAHAMRSIVQATAVKAEADMEAGAKTRLVESEHMAREAGFVEQIRQDNFAIEALGRGLGRLANGELIEPIDTPFGGKIETLRTDFNALVERLRHMVLALGASAQAIGVGAREMSTASDDLSRRTEQQAASLEETAAALDEITATVRKAAEGAVHARQVVAAADADAQKSAMVVRQAVEAMDAIAGSARQISRIIGVIDEIAFQTNLLALNAGVEAARAGEAGRGFAVVAVEVRALAQRSAEAAKEIKGLISASTGQVDHGVKLVAQTGSSLERIMAQVSEINSVVSEIAAGAKEQSFGLDEVNAAVNRMDQATQQNAAMVEQSTAASRSLSLETEQLAELIGEFRVHVAQDDPMRRELQNAAPHAFQTRAAATARSGARAEPRRPALRMQRAASKAAAANGAGDGWEEF